MAAAIVPRRRGFMPVLGIGGLFFRARDPKALNGWYREHLGVGAGCSAEAGPEDKWFWQAQGGPTVFAPFKHTTDYFAADKQWMLNFRVSDLDELLAKLSTAGIDVITKAEWDTPETGRFARIHDPEDNAIELWEPPASLSSP
jgi:predicted enzyme related to lactoylglutathione lyase